MYKLGQKGFTVSTVIILLVVAGLIGFAGYVVFTNRNQGENTAVVIEEQVINKTYTDTAKKFTIQYPETWEATNPEPGGRDYPDGVVPPDPDYSVTSREVQIKPADGYPGNNVRVLPGCTQAEIDDQKARKDRFHTQSDIKINGYDVFYDKLAFQGDAESYINHTYYVKSGNNCLMFDFRENHHHDTSETNFDDEQNLDEFEAIVRSINFTN
jgi:hypothetical protein